MPERVIVFIRVGFVRFAMRGFFSAEPKPQARGYEAHTDELRL